MFIMDENINSQNDFDENYPVANNISSSDLDQETNMKLRGDAIGDTLYSQSFVLKTLLQLSDLKWDEDIEEDLCFLWDMTVEEDVCKYLFELSFPSIACSAIMKYTENRFIEIVIGILANVLCSTCEKNITETEINIILKELNNEDSLILIQVIRFINAIAHFSKDLPFISEDVMTRIEFILYSSTNGELLLKTLEVAAKITSEFKINKTFVNTTLVESSLIAYQSLMDNSSNGDFDLDTKDKQMVCKYMLEIVINVCAYIDQFDDKKNLLELKKHSNVIINEVIKIVDYFSHDENLLPITDEFIFYMSAIRFVIEILNINYITELFLPLTKILYVILNIEEDVKELVESTVELVCFLLFRCSSEILSKDLNHLPKKRIKTILNVVNENKHKFDFNFDIQNLLAKYN